MLAPEEDVTSESVPGERLAVELPPDGPIAHISDYNQIFLTQRVDRMDKAILDIIGRLEGFEQRLTGLESKFLQDSEGQIIQSPPKELCTEPIDRVAPSNDHPTLALDLNDPQRSASSIPHERLLELQNEIGTSHKLENTLWDAVIVASFNVFACHQSALIAFLCFLAFLVESAFVIILWQNELKSQFTSEMVFEMQDWRVLYAHDDAYVNEITGQTLASSVCSLSEALLVGEAQADMFETLQNYGIRERGSLDEPWPLLPVGAWLALIALFVWVSTVVKEVRSIISFANAIWCMPKGRSSCLAVKGDGSITVMSGSFRQAYLLLTFVALPRLIIAVYLGIVGVNFLAATESISELILNAMAMEVVLQIDELLFETILPFDVNHAIDLIDAIPIEPWFLTCKSSVISICATSVVIASLAVAYVKVLEPLVQHMQDVADAMCSGDVRFSFFKDAVGYVYIDPDPTLRKPPDPTQSYAYRAVLQSMRLETNNYLDLVVQTDFDPSTISYIKDLDFQGLAEAWTICADFDNRKWVRQGIRNRFEAGRELARETFGLASIENCSDVLQFCHNVSARPDGLFSTWKARAHCPVTCGCDDIYKSGYVASSKWTGCPDICLMRLRETVQRIQSCDDLPAEHTALQTYLKSMASDINSQWPVHLASQTEKGCAIFATEPMNALCGSDAKLVERALQSPHLFCPKTCHCQQYATRDCPPVCKSVERPSRE